MACKEEVMWGPAAVTQVWAEEVGSVRGKVGGSLVQGQPGT